MSFRFHRIAGQFYNRPLLLTPQAADTISNVLLSRIGDEGAQMGRGGGGGEDNAQTSTTLFPAPMGGERHACTVHTPQASRFYGEVARYRRTARGPMPFRRTAGRRGDHHPGGRVGEPRRVRRRLVRRDLVRGLQVPA
jgi:hypothetical protein